MHEPDVEVIHCPECGGRFTARREVMATLDVDGDVLCLCGSCSAAFALRDAAASALATDAVADDASSESFVERGGRVVVGLELPSAQRAVAEVLRHHGYSPVCVSTGDLVVAACDPVMPERPVAVVLDVAIQGVLAFEAIPAIRAFVHGDAIPIILLASVYERTRYKRRPNRLYGADAYLELHHVPDQLVSMIDALLHDRVPVETRHQGPGDRAKTAPLRDIALGDGPLNPVQAQGLARRLLSDVALYHGDEISQGVKDGAPLRDVTAAIDAAREHFRAHVTEDIELFEAQLDAFVDQLLHRNVAHERAQEEANPSN